MKSLPGLFILFTLVSLHTSCQSKNNSESNGSEHTDTINCNSLVARYVFMTELDQPYAKSSYPSEGYILEGADLYCEPFKDAKIIRKIKRQRVRIIQAGGYEKQHWYKIGFTDTATKQLGSDKLPPVIIGYVKGECIATRSEVGVPCGTTAGCNKLYYTFLDGNAILKAINPKTDEVASLRLNAEGYSDINTWFVCTVGNQFMHLVKFSGGEPGAQRNRQLLLLVDADNGSITNIFDKETFADDDGAHYYLDIYTSVIRQNYEYKYRQEYEYPDNALKVDKKYQDTRYVYIKEEKSEPMQDKTGEYVLDEHGMIRGKVVYTKNSWYKIENNQMKEVK